MKLYDNYSKTEGLDEHLILQIDNIPYKIFKVCNVISYKFNRETFDHWDIETEKIENENDISENYFIMDIDDAFSHWVFENAIYIPAFLELKQQIPNLKIITQQRKYKQQFFNFFKIDDNDIVFNKPEKLEGCYYFISPISSLNEKNIIEEYKLQVNYFFDTFINLYYQPEGLIGLREINRALFMVRQKLENCGNLRENMESIENKYWNDNCVKFDTYENENLDNQIDMVRRYLNIILHDGSAFLVNGMFARDSNIFIMGNITNGQMGYPKIFYIIGEIMKRNRVYRLQ